MTAVLVCSGVLRRPLAVALRAAGHEVVDCAAPEPPEPPRRSTFDEIRAFVIAQFAEARKKRASR